jgi:hypothetical protein
MARKAEPAKQDDPEQSERFIKTAREIGATETKEDADRAFKKVASRRRASLINPSAKKASPDGG